MKLRIAMIFVVLFALSVFVVFYLKDYFFIQTSDHINKQSLTSQAVVDVMNNESIELYDYLGKTLDRKFIYKLTHQKEATKIFHFWASWCDPCAIELPELISYAIKINQPKPLSLNLDVVAGQPRANSPANRGDSSVEGGNALNNNIQIYLISIDSDAEGLNRFVKIFPEILSKNFMQVWDKNNSLSRHFGIDKLPMTIIVFPDGKMEMHEGVVSWKNLSL